MTDMYLSRVHFPVTTLGPGWRLGIWFQGCSLGCDDCISVDTWAPNRGATKVDAVLDAIAPWIEAATGLTISGGEPFQQTIALAALLRRLRPYFPDDVLVYTGYEQTEIQEDLATLPGLIDLLMTGRYVREEPQTLPFRGSDNQTLFALTDAGRARMSQFNQGVPVSGLELDLSIVGGDEFWLAGITGTDDLRRLEEALSKAGNTVSISQSRRSRPAGSRFP